MHNIHLHHIYRSLISIEDDRGAHVTQILPIELIGHNTYCPRRARRHYRNPRVIENMYGITRKNRESQEQGPQRICG